MKLFCGTKKFLTQESRKNQCLPQKALTSSHWLSLSASIKNSKNISSTWTVNCLPATFMLPSLPRLKSLFLSWSSKKRAAIKSKLPKCWASAVIPLPKKSKTINFKEIFFLFLSLSLQSKLSIIY